jgi:hypothetical protein
MKSDLYLHLDPTGICLKHSVLSIRCDLPIVSSHLGGLPADCRHLAPRRDRR